MVVKTRISILIAFLSLLCSCTVFTNSSVVKPEALRNESDIRVEEVYLNSGDTIFINQIGLLATWLKNDQIIFYDHNGEFLKLNIEDVSGLKIRSVDFEASAKTSSFWTWTGILIALACTVGVFIYIIAVGG